MDKFILALFFIASFGAGISIHRFLRKIKTKQSINKAGKIMAVLAVASIVLGIATVIAFATPAQKDVILAVSPTSTAQASTPASTTIPLITNSAVTQSSAAPTETTAEAEATATATEITATAGTLVVHYIDVGQGDAILIQQGTQTMLIDAGSNEEGPSVVTYLKDQGISKIDILIATHPHEDHIGGLDNVIQAFEIGQIIMPDIISTTQTFEDVLLAIKDKGLTITKAVAGTNYELGQAKIQIVGPITIDENDFNNASVVCRITFGENSFLFTGDAEALSEYQIIAAGYDVSANVLKQPHHGSDGSYSAPYALLINPQYSVISVGEGNMYFHPHAETLIKLALAGVSVFRTDLSGTIVATSDGSTISFNVSPDAGIAPTGRGTQTDSETYIEPSETAPAAGQETAASASSSTSSDANYIGNVNSLKFHLPTCKSLPEEQNRTYFETRQEAIDQGYSPCGNCNP